MLMSDYCFDKAAEQRFPRRDRCHPETPCEIKGTGACQSNENNAKQLRSAPQQSTVAAAEAVTELMDKIKALNYFS